ncbi:ATP-binding cassette domain-containing protein [Roseomonas terrae]|uniref:ATP-binding cassette domain-containing protein n=1 Tax=Neoroseomonas terrae TaxID=424799 RepID=A0ABS5EIH2_9PROT|nr:oligopeptide/dipeptide ABC transporter ATP-binding protein [Neoroseomonas terrae]MBR0650831.1 ATP-binding cassette domain-containing protein [Neoroseomonas terrae]
MRPPELVIAEDLTRQFGGGFLARQRPVQAVTGVNLALERGSAVGLVGESGSGKSTIGRLLLGLLPPSDGRVLFDGTDLRRTTLPEMRRLRRRMQLVFQDPYSSLNPRRRVGAQIADGMTIHGLAPRAQISERTAELLRLVGLNPAHGGRFPHEFSGGQRQRIGIARALSTSPDFLVADEPVSALDVSVQAQVLALLADLRARLTLTMVFINHDLAAVRHLCDRVVVLYLGRIMEQGRTEEVFRAPRHPYTQALLSAAPSLSEGRIRQRVLLRGEPPSPANPPPGCVFQTRCPRAVDRCRQEVPTLRPRSAGDHLDACLLGT